MQSLSAFNPGSRVLVGYGWDPLLVAGLYSVRALQQQNPQCQCPARLVAAYGCCPHLELSTVRSPSGDRGQECYR